jgi:hypothetical protein
LSRYLTFLPLPCFSWHRGSLLIERDTKSTVSPRNDQNVKIIVLYYINQPFLDTADKASSRPLVAQLTQLTCPPLIVQQLRGMRHTSTALYFYGASKRTLHKPKVTFGNMLFRISYSLNYNLQFLFQQFLSKTCTHFKKFTLSIKIVFFLKSLLHQFTIVKTVDLQNETVVH